MALKFWKEDKPEGYLSNFYSRKHGPFSLLIDGKEWPTTEHYYQAQKFVMYPEYMEQIRVANTPYMSKILANMEVGHQYAWRIKLNKIIEDAINKGVTMRNDWEVVKETVMKRALIEKFRQNEYLRQKLINTGSAILQEASPYDYYWGVGANGTGKNRLGILLMEVREMAK